MFIFGVFLVRIFPHLDWILRDTTILRICPYSVRIRENMDQKSSKYRQFSRNVGKHIFINLNSNQIMKIIRFITFSELCVCWNISAGLFILNQKQKWIFWKLPTRTVKLYTWCTAGIQKSGRKKGFFSIHYLNSIYKMTS